MGLLQHAALNSLDMMSSRIYYYIGVALVFFFFFSMISHVSSYIFWTVTKSDPMRTGKIEFSIEILIWSSSFGINNN